MSSELSPADAFGLLADETRLAIVEALIDSAFESMGDPVSFSDLRRSVGVDDAGKFNYHLGRLQPQFVEKQADGYVPRFAALEAVGAARAGTFTELPEERRAELDVDCHECGNPLEGVHRGSSIRVQCEDDGWFFQSIVPPRTAAERSVQEVVRYAIRDTQREIEKLVDGVCMLCGGPIEKTVPGEASFVGDESAVTAELDCTHCAYRMQIPIAVSLIRHPAVVAHHWRHGVDLRDEPIFAPNFVGPGHVTVEREDPFQATVDVGCGGESIQVRIDGDLNAMLLD